MTHNEITTKDYEIDYSNPLSEWIGRDIIWMYDGQIRHSLKSEKVRLIAVCKDCMIVEEILFEGLKHLGISPTYHQVKLGKNFVSAPDNWTLCEEDYPGPQRDPQYLYMILTNRI